MFILFLWEPMSVAISSMLLNQFRHHIVNVLKKWGNAAFMVNCILNFSCAVFTFQASLPISSILSLHVWRNYQMWQLGPLQRSCLHSNVIMLFDCEGVNYAFCVTIYCTLQVSSTQLTAGRELHWQWRFTETKGNEQILYCSHEDTSTCGDVTLLQLRLIAWGYFSVHLLP